MDIELTSDTNNIRQNAENIFTPIFQVNSQPFYPFYPFYPFLFYGFIANLPGFGDIFQIYDRMKML